MVKDSFLSCEKSALFQQVSLSHVTVPFNRAYLPQLYVAHTTINFASLKSESVNRT